MRCRTLKKGDVGKGYKIGLYLLVEKGCILHKTCVCVRVFSRVRVCVCVCLFHRGVSWSEEVNTNKHWMPYMYHTQPHCNQKLDTVTTARVRAQELSSDAKLANKRRGTPLIRRCRLVVPFGTW